MSTEVALTSDIELSAFYAEPTSSLEQRFHFMCPVHVLQIYLCPVACSRGPYRSLFVHWDEAKTYRPVSKQWISAVFSEVIHRLIAGWVNRTVWFMLILTQFGAWQLSGPKLPESRLQKSVVRLSGRPHVRLPNTTIWILPRSPLALFLTWLHKDDWDKANTETPCPSLVPFYLAFAVSLGLGVQFLWLPPWLVLEWNWVLEGCAFPWWCTALCKLHFAFWCQQSNMNIYWLVRCTCSASAPCLPRWFLLPGYVHVADSCYWAWEEGGGGQCCSTPHCTYLCRCSIYSCLYDVYESLAYTDVLSSEIMCSTCVKSAFNQDQPASNIFYPISVMQNQPFCVCTTGIQTYSVTLYSKTPFPSSCIHAEIVYCGTNLHFCAFTPGECEWFGKRVCSLPSILFFMLLLMCTHGNGFKLSTHRI